MNSNVIGTLRAEFNDGDVKEKDINARAIFLVSIAINKEDLPEDQEAMDVALMGATNASEFIEKISEAVTETLEHMAKDKVQPVVLYFKLMDRLARCISEKVGDRDMELLKSLMEN